MTDIPETLFAPFRALTPDSPIPPGCLGFLPLFGTDAEAQAWAGAGVRVMEVTRRGEVSPWPPEVKP